MEEEDILMVFIKNRSKENVSEDASQTYVITLQNYFRMYNNI